MALFTQMKKIGKVMETNRKYTTYKNSGVEWLGEVPENWKILRIKNACKINENCLLESTPKSYEFEYVDIGSVSFEEGIFQTEHFNFKNAPSRARRIAKQGNVIVSTVRTYLKAIDYIDELKSRYIFSTGFAILSTESLEPKFLYHFIKSDSFTNQVDAVATGMSYPAINSTKLSSLFICNPTLSEQKAIAQFLDKKTALIDKAIQIKEKQIALLQERRQILIQQAVTRGLDPNVPLKDSGVDWIGMIPEHWEVKRLKYVLKERNERSKDGLEPLLMVSQIHGLVVRSEYHEKAEVAQSSEGNKIVHYNDLVFNKLKAHLGVFFKSEIPFHGIVSPDYAVYFSQGVIEDLKYLELLFRKPEYIKEFICRATGIVEGLIRLYTFDLFDIQVPVPPIQEQKNILLHIQKYSDTILNTIKLKEKEIEKLKEYKSTLINSAVTGKIKVS